MGGPEELKTETKEKLDEKLKSLDGAVKEYQNAYKTEKEKIEGKFTAREEFQKKLQSILGLHHRRFSAQPLLTSEEKQKLIQTLVLANYQVQTAREQILKGFFEGINTLSYEEQQNEILKRWEMIEEKGVADIILLDQLLKERIQQETQMLTKELMGASIKQLTMLGKVLPKERIELLKNTNAEKQAWIEWLENKGGFRPDVLKNVPSPQEMAFGLFMFSTLIQQKDNELATALETHNEQKQFELYQAFLNEQGLDPQEFCANVSWYEKLYEDLGVEERVHQATGVSANVEIKSFPTSAQYRKEILVLEELIEAAHGQGKADTDSEVKALLDLKKAYTQVEINIRHQEALFGNLAFDLNDEIDWVSSGVGKLAGEKTGITAKETMMDIKDWVKKSLTPPSMGDDVGKWFGFTVKALGAATAVIGAFKMGKSLIHVLTGGGQGRWGSFKDILKTGTLTTLVAGGMVVAGNAISDPKAAEKKAREWAGIVKGEGEAAYETARAHLTPDAAANLAFVSLKVTEADRKKLIVENPARSDFDKMMWKKENLALKPEEWESLHRLLGPWVKEKFGVDVKDYQKHLECMRDFQQEVLKGMKIDITAGSNREISIDFQKWNTFLSDTYVQSNADPNNPQDYLFSVEQLSGLGFLLPAEKTQATTNRMASFRPSHELQKTMIKQGLWLKRLNTPPTPPSPPSP